jgi:hypothetical protein
MLDKRASLRRKKRKLRNNKFYKRGPCHFPDLVASFMKMSEAFFWPGAKSQSPKILNWNCGRVQQPLQSLPFPGLGVFCVENREEVKMSNGEIC